MEIKVPSIDIDMPTDMASVDSEHIQNPVEPTTESGPGETENYSHETNVTAETSGQTGNVADPGMISVGDLHVDQLPSSTLSTHASGEDTEEVAGNFADDQKGDVEHHASPVHGESMADNTAGPESVHDQAAAQPDAHEQAQAGQEHSAPAQATETVMHQSSSLAVDNGSQPQEQSTAVEANVTTAESSITTEPAAQSDINTDDDIASVGQTPTVVLADDNDQAASSSETGLGDTSLLDSFDGSAGNADASLDHFAVTDAGGNVGAEGSLDHFMVSDADPAAMDEIPAMDGLDATPAEQPLPEPEDAGLGVDDAIIPEDIQDPAPIHHEVVAT
jgi:hypothetical protein